MFRRITHWIVAAAPVLLLVALLQPAAAAAGAAGLDFHVVSFSVGNERYHEAKERLRQSCIALGIPHSMDKFAVESQDSSQFDIASVMDVLKGVTQHGTTPISTRQWALQYTYSFKPLYILYKLMTLKSAVLWMDSDLQFEKVPELLRADVTRRPIDLGVVNNKPFWKHTIWDGYSMYASSGVIFFNYTKPTIELVEEWIRHVNFGTNVAAADDKQLDEVYNARWATKLEEKNMNVAWLPRSYLQFYTAQSNTVILHPGALSVKPRQVGVRKAPGSYFADLPSPYVKSLVARIGQRQQQQQSRSSSAMADGAVQRRAQPEPVDAEEDDEEIYIDMRDLQEDWDLPDSVDL